MPTKARAGYHLYSHSGEVGKFGFSGAYGFSVYGNENTRFSEDCEIPDTGHILDRDFFYRFGKTIPRQREFESIPGRAVNYGMQPVQVTTFPVAIRRNLYEPRQEKAPGLRGWLGGKQSSQALVGTASYTTSQILEECAIDEPAFVAQWGIPWLFGVHDRRPGGYFKFSIVIGESFVPHMTTRIKDDPGMVRNLGESIFSDVFVSLGETVPYRQLPHYVLERLPLSEENLRRVE